MITVTDCDTVELAVQIPLSMPSAPSRMAASKLASVFSGNAADAYSEGE